MEFARGWARRVLPRIALAVFIAAASLALYVERARFGAGDLAGAVAEFGIAAPLLYIAGRAVGAVFFVPGSAMAMMAGAMFGPVAGAIYNLVASTLGAMFAFLIARYLASTWTARRLGGRLGKLIDGVEAEGWRFVAFVRLVPLFPYNLLNYALGLTRISFTHYAVASLVFMIPGDIAYVYLGYAGREAMAGNESSVEIALVALGLLAAIVFLPRLVRRWRRT